MSIIGPRPLPVPEQAACDEYQSQRLLVKPGLSCYAALDPTAHDDFDKWIEYDLRYIEPAKISDEKIAELSEDLDGVLRFIKISNDVEKKQEFLSSEVYAQM